MVEIQTNISIPIVILTGFLGAGKTSFLSQYLQAEGMQNSAVIINEFGEFGLDHLLVEHVDDQVIDLPDGCLCCAVHNELIDKLSELLAGRINGDKNFNRIIIETSGLSDPVNLLATLWNNHDIRTLFHISKVITLISTIDWNQIKLKYPEVLKQLAFSDAIILSKADLLPESTRNQEIAYVQTELSKTNDHAKCYLSPLKESQLNEITVEISTVKANYPHKSNEHHHLAGYNTLTITHPTPIATDTIEKFMDTLVVRYPDEILRVKGLVLAIENQKNPLLVQSVKSTVSPNVWLENWKYEPQTHLTIIHTGKIEKQITDLFYGYTDTIMPDRADKQALTQNPLLIPGVGKF